MQTRKKSILEGKKCYTNLQLLGKVEESSATLFIVLTFDGIHIDGLIGDYIQILY